MVGEAEQGRGVWFPSHCQNYPQVHMCTMSPERSMKDKCDCLLHLTVCLCVILVLFFKYLEFSWKTREEGKKKNNWTTLQTLTTEGIEEFLKPVRCCHGWLRFHLFLN